MLLLTGATGTIGTPLLRRLADSGAPVRCLVRDPRRLGSERVRVQLALGDLGDPHSLRNALRGVDTVVHLASTIRDQRAGTIEELAGVATWRLVRAAEREGVRRFVFFSALGASPGSPSRLLRAKALAERAVLESSLEHTVFAPGWVYSAFDQFMRLTQSLALLPAMPLMGSGAAQFQPIWSEDVAECVLAALPGGPMAEEAKGARFELAGPQTLSYRHIVQLVLEAQHRQRRLVPLPRGLVRRTLELTERIMGPAAPATWDEVCLLQIPLITSRGLENVRRLRVEPRSMASVLGAA